MHQYTYCNIICLNINWPKTVREVKYKIEILELLIRIFLEFGPILKLFFCAVDL